MKRYAHLSKWISLAALALLASASVMPWAYFPDLGKEFTGFFSEGNAYGKPAKLVLILSGLCTLLAFVPRIWAKRLAMFVAAFLLAYGVSVVYRYVRCYGGGICPEIRKGLVITAVSILVVFLSALFPEGSLQAEKKDQPAVKP